MLNDDRFSGRDVQLVERAEKFLHPGFDGIRPLVRGIGGVVEIACW